MWSYIDPTGLVSPESQWGTPGGVETKGQSPVALRCFTQRITKEETESRESWFKQGLTLIIRVVNWMTKY